MFSLIYIIIIVYLCIVLLSFFYIKKDSITSSHVKYIIILSASNKLLTRQRLNRAQQLYEILGKPKIVLSGKYMSKYMLKFMKERKFSGVITQDKSTNTLEDAIFCREIITLGKRDCLALITHSSHQRRAYRTFSKVFKTKILSFPVNPIFAIDSIVLPTGWISTVVNVFKDWKYNGFYSKNIV